MSLPMFAEHDTVFAMPGWFSRRYCRWETSDWYGWVDSDLYEHLPDPVRQNPEKLLTLPQSVPVRDARNLLKRLRIGQTDLWLKRFGKAHIVDAAVYAFRAGKSAQSWNKSLALIAAGFHVPRPLLALRGRGIGKGMMGLFGSQHVNAIPLQDLMAATGAKEKQASLIRQLGSFLAGLHNQGFRHRDLRQGNLLVQECGLSTFRFYLIDVNRLQRYESLNWTQRIRELERLFLVGPEAEWFFEGYAADRNVTEVANDYRRRVRYAEELEYRTLGRLRRKLWYYLWELRAFPPGVHGSRPVSMWPD